MGLLGIRLVGVDAETRQKLLLSVGRTASPALVFIESGGDGIERTPPTMRNWVWRACEAIADRNEYVERIQTHWLSILVASGDEPGHIGPMKRLAEMIAEWMHLSCRQGGPRVGSMTGAWLREHEAESEKHADVV